MKKIFDLAWSDIKPYFPYVIGAIILIAWFIFRPVNDNTGHLDQYENVNIENAGKIEVYKKNAKRDSLKIVKLEKELVVLKATKDSLGVMVDNIAPGVAGTITYISTPGPTQQQVDSARAGLMADIQIVKLERIALKETILKQDDLIASQKNLIANLNEQINLLADSSLAMESMNKGLKKQIRKEVRKRRLTGVLGVAAVVTAVVLMK